MPNKEDMMQKMQKMAEGGQPEASLVGDAEYWSEIKLSSDILRSYAIRCIRLSTRLNVLACDAHELHRHP